MPLRVPLVPLVTVKPAVLSPLTDPLKVTVKLIGLVLVGEAGPLTVAVGGMLDDEMRHGVLGVGRRLQQLQLH